MRWTYINSLLLSLSGGGITANLKTTFAAVGAMLKRFDQFCTFIVHVALCCRSPKTESWQKLQTYLGSVRKTPTPCSQNLMVRRHRHRLKPACSANKKHHVPPTPWSATPMPIRASQSCARSPSLHERRMDAERGISSSMRTASGRSPRASLPGLKGQRQWLFVGSLG